MPDWKEREAINETVFREMSKNEDRGHGEEGRTPEERDRAAKGGHAHPRDRDELKVPRSIEAQDELVDRASEDSFPASDAPAYWQRPGADQ